ncbi:MAG: hypothetical protein JOZ38_02025 [Candidatus Eremiobacteraeota bacterium]|nr:hypothetical protein [Candidatus Eremiobacteraeota bacterium]
MKLVRIALAIAAMTVLARGAASAMPIFAQAYGLKCSVCHTQVPALNDYGRYVQRTGYASLDSNVLHSVSPFWIGEQANYDTQSSTAPHQTQFGNLAIHAAGALNDDFTYHAQQWILQNNQTGGPLDTFWITYNNLFHRDGHLFLGKLPTIGPSPYSQWMDISGFSVPAITVGEHPYLIGANRWGPVFKYVKKSLDFETGYEGNTNDWQGLGDFSYDTDRTWDWKVAYANPVQPLEVGVFGGRGTFPLAEGSQDQYYDVTEYVQRDPQNGIPGIFAFNQMTKDANPGFDPLGNPLGPTSSHGQTVELYEPIGDKAVFSARKEWMNDGLGNVTQDGVIDLNYHIARFLMLYGEVGMAQNSTPAWRYMIWWTLPTQSVK